MSGKFTEDGKFVPTDPSVVAARKILEHAEVVLKEGWALAVSENDTYVFERGGHPQVIFIYSPEMNILSARIQYNPVTAYKTLSCGYSGIFSAFIENVFRIATIPFPNIKIEDLEA